MSKLKILKEKSLTFLGTEKALKIAEKLLLPTILAIFVINSRETNNELISKQTELLAIQNKINEKYGQGQLDVKYLELFYIDMTSMDEEKKTASLGLLQVMNPELAKDLSAWTKNNITLDSAGIKKINELDINIAQKQSNSLKEQGISLHRQGKFRSAIEIYRQALELNPKDYELYEYFGHTNYKIGNLGKAEIYLRKSITINSKHKMGYYNLSLVLWDLGKKNEALECLRKVIELDKNYLQIIKGDGQFSKFQQSRKFNSLFESQKS
ncbi:tetratricopeptide repeat protein [Croceitalea rosinachiae]|uniref:DUF705 domain-containing protein n=1 Tax=Croceitalea rosinachiae TaxID=3075596 RepID=A0ABU3ACV9_9FLAO|nr:DUF705 domain-containing protein [Croceitalea sp. F388]MDT0608019.1 DUF705 domain-containing protein [Croceitalea sp. F388]